MASTKFPPATAPAAAAPARVATAAVKTPAMKAPPVLMKSAGAPPPAPPAATASASTAGPMKRETLVVAFLDLARFQIASRRVKDEALVELLEDYYDRIADGLKPAGGRVVKFMGDGAMVVFPIERASQAARAMLMLKSSVDASLSKKKFPSVFVARMHVTEAMAGSFGPKSDKRYDVIGHGVNRTAAMRASEGFALTGEAWEKLDARTQKLFRQKGDSYVPA